MSGSRYKLKCPHCGSSMRVRNSVYMHDLMRNVYFQCQNITCGATFKGHMEITHTLSPAANPNPSIDLPMADIAMRRMATQEEDDKQVDLEDLLAEGADA